MSEKHWPEIERETTLPSQYIEPSRVLLVRQYRGLSRKELADKCEVTPGYIRYLERDYPEFEPAKEFVARMALALGWPMAFFYGDEIELMRPEQMNGWVSGSAFLDAQIDTDMARFAEKPPTEDSE